MQMYLLSVAAVGLVSALYSFQNADVVSVHFLFFTHEVSHGVWGAALFAGGAGLMWVASIVASWEARSAYKKQIRSLEERIRGLEAERTSIIHAAAAAGVSYASLEKSTGSDNDTPKDDADSNSTTDD